MNNQSELSSTAKILIIEDEQVLALDLAEMLREWGHEVVGSVSTGEEAVQQAQALNPDLVLTDIVLKGKMDGIEASNIISELCDAAIVYLTAYEENDLFDRAKVTMPYGYLTKPVAAKDLKRTVEMALYKHQIEKRLREREEHFRELTDFLPEIVFEVDEQGMITFANQSAFDITGYSREDLEEGFFSLNLLAPDDRERALENLAKAMKGNTLDFSEYVAQRKDGSLFPVMVRSASIMSRGRIVGLRGIIVDMTEHKRRHEALLESEQMFRLLSEQSLMSVAVLQDGTYKYANQAMADLTEYSVDEILNWKPEEFLEVAHPEDRNLVMEQARMKQSGDPRQKAGYEFRILAKGGKTKWVEIYSKTVQFKGRSANLLTMIDISGRKKVEEQLIHSQKMEAVGTLAGGIAHDINNLLQVVLGQADMVLLRGGLDEKTVKSLNAIRGSARNGADLVKRILAFSRDSIPEMRPVNLSDELLRMEGLLQRTIPKMITIEMHLENDLWMISADPSQLEQVILNMAINAKDAMHDGGRLVFETKNETVRAEYSRIHPEIKPGKYVLMTVLDTGQGIGKDALDRIFEPFFTTKDPGQGTGLGLSMVFGIVKGHGGHISCYSEVGGGTTFKIYFPVSAADLPKAVLETIEMPAGGTETILLVDDEEPVRSLGAEMLALAGYKVLIAENGPRALEIYRRQKQEIALVILDLVMPEMSGRKCFDELRKTNPSVKVLIASGHSPNGQARDTLKNGAEGFIQKPFDIKQLLVAVRKVLGSANNSA